MLKLPATLNDMQSMIAEDGLVTKRQLSLASGVESHCYASLDTRGALAAAMYARLAWGGCGEIVSTDRM